MKLQIRNLSVAYDADTVLHNIDLDVAEGEFVSLLGPSGCGKTTLMKTVAGLLPAKQGTISVDGEDITRLPVHKRGTVVMFQDIRLFPHMTVAENVAFPLKMQGMEKHRRLALAEEYLKKVQMDGLEKRRPAELSGGQQQRVALARALAARPRLLLLDEPFSALDENLREDMRALVLQLKQEFGMTALLVTHDREEALSMSDRVVLMFRGKIAQSGTPQQVYHHPVSCQVADYFGGWIHISGFGNNGIFFSGGFTLPCPSADGPGQLLLRPDNLVPDDTGSYRVCVQDIRFLGREHLVSLLGEDGTVWKKLLSNHTQLYPGEFLHARISPEGALFFPDRT